MEHPIVHLVFLSFFWYSPAAPFAQSFEPSCASRVIGLVERRMMLPAQFIPACPPARRRSHYSVVLHDFVQGIGYEPMPCYTRMDLIQQPFIARDPIRRALLDEPADIDKRYLISASCVPNDFVHGFEDPQRANVLFLGHDKPLLRFRIPANSLVALTQKKEKAGVPIVDRSGLLKESNLPVCIGEVRFSIYNSQKHPCMLEIL